MALPPRSGQSIIEVLVAVAIGAIFFAGTVALVAPSLQINQATSQIQVAAALGKQMMDNVRVWSEGSWNNVLSLATGSSEFYGLNTSSSPFVAIGPINLNTYIISSTTFSVGFYLNDVYRDPTGNITSTPSGNTYDPSTKQVTVFYRWKVNGGNGSSVNGNVATTTITAYITRNHANVFNQTDWSGGPGFNGPATTTNAGFSTSTNINYANPGSLNVVPPPSLWANGYTYRRSITVSSSLIAPSGTALTNFPMLVSGTYNYLEASSSGGYLQSANGYDIIFTSDASGTVPLSYERESYSSSTGAVNIWVKIPTLSSSSNQIYLFYDKPSVAADPSSPSSTWNGNYTNVYHFPAPTGTLTAYDSTGNTNNGTVHAGATATSSGQIDGAAAMDGVSTAGEVTYYEAGSIARTVSMWIKETNYSNYYAYIYYLNSTGYIAIRTGNYGQCLVPIVGSSGFGCGAGSNFTDGNFHYVVITSNASNTSEYFDGNLYGVSTGQSAVPSDTVLLGYNGGLGFAGTLDEVREANVALSSDWIKTEYNNQSMPSNFYTLGAAAQGNNVTVTSGAISSSTNLHWAWNDTIGWIDFYNNNNVTVSSTHLTGYASSSVGDISLDCATTRNGNICTGPTSTSPIVRAQSIASYPSLSVTLSSSTHSGDLLIFGCSDYSNDTGMTVSDSASDTWNALPWYYSSSQSVGIQLFYAMNINGAGSDTITASAPGQGDLGCSAAEYSGVATSSALDVFATTTVATATTTPTSNVLTTTSSDLIYSYWADESESPGSISAGSGYTLLQANLSHYDAQENGTGTAGSYKPSFTTGSGVADSILYSAAFKPGTNTTSRQYQVVNDGSGDLSGWAWNDQVGWISFCGGTNSANCPGTVNYETTIDSNGNFQGWAWNDGIGWISFNCDNNSSCGTSNYEVQTSWLPPVGTSTAQLTSEIFDTNDASGAQFNSILWQGTSISGSTVQFQLAVSNSSSGPWSYTGPDGTANTYYTPTGPGSAVGLNDAAYSGFRYFRYKIFILFANGSSSQVNGVVVNWSP